MRASEYTDVVVLVPGFLGFSRFTSFYYFADRVSAALRASLEGQAGFPVPIIPASTKPTRSLAARQRCLLDTLRGLQCAFPNVQRFHLVGHSTGGVDAQLLLRSRPVGSAKEWSVDDQPVRHLIGSVTTLGAPHHGTWLVEHQALKEFRRTLVGPRLVGVLARVAPGLLSEWWNSEARNNAIAGGVGGALDVAAYVADVLYNRDLVEDLRPQSMTALRHASLPDLARPVNCFVTVAPPSRRDPYWDRRALFQELQRLTARVDGAPSADVGRALELLRGWRGPMVTSWWRPTFDLASNDGVVNSVHQLLVDPLDHATLRAVVVGDHADVIGHYDRQDFLTGQEMVYGFFDSGAQFRDDEFFGLYHLVAESIVEAMASDATHWPARVETRAMTVAAE